MYKKFFKRLIDIIFSLLGILLFAPILILISIFIKIDSKGKIFFKQKRIGRYKKEFEIYKFRTMKNSTPKDTPTHLFENPDQYITKAGRILRKTSLDELPQIFNILRGDMSIIGPRPALWNQYDLTKLRDLIDVHEVRPGLTGWAQINGRDELNNLEKAKLDAYYVKNMSLYFDVQCFFKTILYVLKEEGILEGSKNGRK